MEIRINLALLAILATCWFAMAATRPVSAMDPTSAETRELEFLEDAFAKDPSNELLAIHLMSRYLELSRPGLAIAASRSSDPILLDHPMVSHHLARAYEAVDQPLDALATARLARARCARIVGSRHAGSLSAVPEHSCSEAQYAVLDMHQGALERMVAWGVSRPSVDPRAQTAYQVAVRRARVAIVAD